MLELLQLVQDFEIILISDIQDHFYQEFEVNNM